MLNRFDVLFSTPSNKRPSSSIRRQRKAAAAKLRHDQELARAAAHEAQISREEGFDYTPSSWDTVEQPHTEHEDVHFDPWECIRNASVEDIQRVRSGLRTWGVFLDEHQEYDMWRPSPFELLQLRAL